ncbi:GntR family transcriptional regulator [Brevundimonas sp.]|jgi:GntR family transcriptional regulator|uniref:GntR family transcriptional regulator n=1 Tax=Brevundimonas sp. TaxID=1871086 RepID=UPI0037C16B5A
MKNPAADRRLPLYHQIRDSIAARIADGEWGAGDCIASESQLAETYGVAVGTIRRATDLLGDEGLIERVQGRGMFVRRADFANSLFRFFRLSTENGQPLTPTSRILSRERVEPTDDVKAHLSLRSGEGAIRMVRTRESGDRVLLHEEIWLSAKAFGAIVDIEISELLPLLYPAYERLFGRVVARAKERLSVASANAVVAQALSVTPGAIVIRIERLAFDHAGNPLEWRISHGSADGFAYEIDVT